MKHSTVLLLICALALCAAPGVRAQIIIQKSDVDAAYTDAVRTIYGVHSDTIDALAHIDLGTASSSAQNLNFASIPITSPRVGRDTTEQRYVAPAGHLRAEDFPGASFCFEASQSQTSGGYTITLTQAAYVSSETDGGYLLGFAVRIQVSPTPPPGFPFPEDTTVVAKFRPKSLGFPLPKTLGTSRTATDTVDSPFENETEVSTRTFTANGYGNVTYPDGIARQSLRVVQDRSTATYRGGVLVSTEQQKTVMFIGSDLTQLSFDVDLGYSGGATDIRQYELEVRTGTVDVRLPETALPEEYILGQNYPNPFNPATTIRFEVPQAGFVSLKVYDVLGREVETLVNGRMFPGSYDVPFDASLLPSGVYIYRLVAGAIVESRRMVLAK